MVKLRFVWGLPVLVLPSWNAWGHQFGPLVFLPKEKRDSATLLAHELWHVRQFIATLGLVHIVSPVSARFRFRVEAAAYAEAVRHGDDLGRCARGLASGNYGLGIDVPAARAAISTRVDTRALF